MTPTPVIVRSRNLPTQTYGKVYIDLTEICMGNLGCVPDGDIGCMAGDDHPYDLAIYLLDEICLGTMSFDELDEMSCWRREEPGISEECIYQSALAEEYIRHVVPHLRSGWELHRRHISDEGLMDIDLVRYHYANGKTTVSMDDIRGLARGAVSVRW